MIFCVVDFNLFISSSIQKVWGVFQFSSKIMFNCVVFGAFMGVFNKEMTLGFAHGLKKAENASKMLLKLVLIFRQN